MEEANMSDEAKAAKKEADEAKGKKDAAEKAA